MEKVSKAFKTKLFAKWADKIGLSDAVLLKAVSEIDAGNIDADLGGNVIKKRIPLGSKGKSGGVRAILAYRIKNKAFFIYGFAKNDQENISTKELKALKAYSKILVHYSDAEILHAIKQCILMEVKNG